MYFSLDASPFLDAPEDQAYDGIRNPHVLVMIEKGPISDYDNLKRFIAGFRSVKEYFDLGRGRMLHLLKATLEDKALGEWI